MTYRAVPFQASSPDARIQGQIVLSFTQSLEAAKIAPILPRHGFEKIEADAWYSQQKWMDVLKEISELPDSDAALVSVGKRVVSNAEMPPEIKSIPDALRTLHDIHHAYVKNIPAEEGYAVREISEKHYHVYHNTPNPDIGVYGFIWSMAARFKQPDEIFRVTIIPNPNPDEMPGSVFNVVWGKTL
jgi:hypothetical protein